MARDGHQTPAMGHDVNQARDVPIVDVRRGLDDLANLPEQSSAHSFNAKHRQHFSDVVRSSAHLVHLHK